MQRALKIGRPGVIVAIAAVVGAVWCAGALAGTNPYTVQVYTAPHIVKLNAHFKVKVTGNSANTSRLRVYLNRINPCSVGAKKNGSHPDNFLIINTNVTGTYTEIRTFKATHVAHAHFVCAYLAALPPAHLQRARAGTHYQVT